MSGHGGGGGTPLREVFAKFTTEFDGNPLIAGAQLVQGLMGRFAALKKVIVDNAVTGVLIHMTHSFIEAGHELMVTSEQLQVSAEALKFWQAAAKMSGVETEELNTSLKFLQRNAYEAATGGGEIAEKFAAAGVKVKDANGQIKNGDQLLRELADGLAKTENPAKRVAIAQGLLGRSGSRLLPLLTKGSEGIEEMRGELEALGISFSADGAKKAEEAHHAMLKYDLVLSSIKAKLTSKIVPLFTVFYGWLAKTAGAFNLLVKNSSLAQVALAALGGYAVAMAAKTLIAFWPLIASTLAWVAGLSLAALAIEDVVTFLRGGDSLLGRWIDKTWGVGAAAQVLEKVSGWWESISTAVASAWPEIQKILPSIEQVGSALEVVGKALAYVVNLFAELFNGKVDEGMNKLGDDISKFFGFKSKTADEKKFTGGADLSRINDTPAQKARGYGVIDENRASAPGSDASMSPAAHNALAALGRGWDAASVSETAKHASDEDRQKQEYAMQGQGLSNAWGATKNAAGSFVDWYSQATKRSGPAVPVSGAQSAEAGASNITINVDANAKPDPNLVPMITKAVQDAQDKTNRNMQAGH